MNLQDELIDLCIYFEENRWTEIQHHTRSDSGGHYKGK